MTPVRCVFVTVGLALVAAGCQGDAKPTSKSESAAAGSASPARQDGGECEAVLSSIDDIFQLQRLGRTTAVSDGVSRLNDWQRACGSDVAYTDFKLPPDVRKVLSDDEARSLTETRFNLRDGEHIRDCLLERAVSGYAVGEGQTDLEKVTNVFGHVVRAIGLVSQPLHDLPLTVYEVSLLGKGTAADRAWIFANLLRQMKIDAVLIYPKKSGKAPAAADEQPMLVGVLLDGQVYLFDPQAGVPVPASGAASALSRVATLAEAANDAAVFKQLDASGRPYPIAASDLEHPGVAIVGDTGFWSARMQALQTQFVGNRAMIIADPLFEPDDGSGGLWMRVVKAGGDRWSAADVQLWHYPEERLASHVRMNKEQQEILEGLLKPFDAFLSVVKGPQGGPVFVEKERAIDPAADQKLHPGVHVNEHITVGEQLRARLNHLGGDYSEAVKRYTHVRGKSKEVLDQNPPLPIRSSHSRAIDDALYWTALCQFEQGEFKSAVNNLTQYRKKQGESGHWGRESRYLLALSLAATGDRAGAVGLLEPVDSDDPEYTGYRLLIRQWQAAKKTPTKEPS